MQARTRAEMFYGRCTKVLLTFLPHSFPLEITTTGDTVTWNKMTHVVMSAQSWKREQLKTIHSDVTYRHFIEEMLHLISSGSL